MPRGVDGTGHWASTPHGTRVWVEDTGPPKLEDAVRTLREHQANKSNTNKDTAESKATPKPQTKPQTKPAAKPPASRTKPRLTAKQQKQVKRDERRVANKQAAEQAAQRRRQQMLNMLTKRAKKVNRRLQDQLAEINKKRDAFKAEATVIQKQLNAARAAGNYTLVDHLNTALGVQNKGLLRLEHEEEQAHGKQRRSGGFDALAARNAVYNAQQAYSGAELGEDPHKYHMVKPETDRTEYGFGSLVKDQYETKYKTEPGQIGHGKSIKRAMGDDLGRAMQHPEWFDTQEGAEQVNSGVFAHWEEADAHAKLINVDMAGYQQKQKVLNRKFVRARRKYAASGSEKDYKALLVAIKNYKDLARDPDYRKLIAEYDTVYGKNAIRPDFKVTKATQMGLFWFFETGVRQMYRNVEDRQREIEDMPENADALKRLEDDIAASEADLRALHERLEPEEYDLWSAQMKPQSYGSWRRQVERFGLPRDIPGVEQEKWEESLDVRKRASETAEHPVYKHFYPKLAEAGIETGDDLRYSSERAKVDKFAFQAVLGAMDDWQASDEFEPPSEEVIMDEARYQVDVNGNRFFVMEDQSPLYQGAPLPKDRSGVSHPEPLWDKCSLAENIDGALMCSVVNSFELARANADDDYMKDKQNQFNTMMEQETGRAVRDALAYQQTGSELLGGVIAGATSFNRHLQATHESYTGIDANRSENHMLTDLTPVDHWAVADQMQREWMASDDWFDPTKKYGLDDEGNYRRDEDGIYFHFEGEEGSPVKVRRNEALPVPPIPHYNGGNAIQPFWFDPDIDGLGVAGRQGQFESDAEYRKSLQQMPPTPTGLAIRAGDLHAEYIEGYKRQAFEASGGTTDLAVAMEQSGEWELVYQGKTADQPGGPAKPEVIGSEWGIGQDIIGALQHVVSVVGGEEITVIKSVREERYRSEAYFTLDLPLADGRLWEAPFVVGHEFGAAVGEEIDADIAKANEAWHEGNQDIWIESMNETGMPVQYGSMADVINLTFEMVVDITNWIPFIGAGKRGLNGITAAVAAGRIPNTSATAKVAAAVGQGIRAARTHPDTYQAAGALARDVEKSFGIASEEFSRFLKEELTGLADDLNTPEGMARSINRVVEYFAKKDPNLNPQQLHRWVEMNLTEMFRARGIIIHTTPDAARLKIEKMKAATTADNAQEVNLVNDIQMRAKREADAFKKAQDDARIIERAKAKRAAEDLKKKTATQERYDKRLAEARKKEEARLTAEGRAGEAYSVKIDKGPMVTVKSGWDKATEPKLLADVTSGKSTAAPKATRVEGGRTITTETDAKAAAEAGRLKNRGPVLPDFRLKKRPKGFIGPMGKIGREELRTNIDNALAEIAEAERKLTGKPSVARQTVLEQEKVEWGNLLSRLQQEVEHLDNVERAVAEAKATAYREVTGVWEPKANPEGVLINTRIRRGEYDGEDLDTVTDLLVEQALKDAGYAHGPTEFQNYKRWVRDAHREASGEYNKLKDELSGGNLNPNLNIEKNLTIIAEQNEVIALEFAYGRLRLNLGAPQELYRAHIPGTVGRMEAIARAENLAETLAHTSIIRRATLSDAVRQAENAKGFERRPYQLDEEFAKQYKPREPMGSADEALRSQEAGAVQRYRHVEGVASAERNVSDWGSGQRVAFDHIPLPPGSRLYEDEYFKSLDAVINGPDYEAAAQAYHEKSIIAVQSWNRFNALTNGSQYPNGYQGFLTGSFLEPDSMGRLHAQQRGFREVRTRQRMGQPTDNHFMVLSDQSDDVYMMHVRKVTVENDPRGRTASEIAGDGEYWGYADQGRGPGRDVGRIGRGELPRMSDDLATGESMVTRGGEDVAGESQGFMTVRPGDDLARAAQSNLSHTWYQPWEAHARIAGQPAMAGKPGSTWWQLSELGRDVDFVKSWEANDLVGWVESLHAARLKGKWDAPGAVDFRRTMQPMVDMFHNLHRIAATKKGAEASEAWLTLQRFHDVFSTMHLGGRATQDFDDFISTWLMMESRMGLPFAYPPDYALWNFKRMAKMRGMMPERAVMMVQHKHWAPRWVGAHSDLNPSIEPLFAPGNGPRVGGKHVKKADGGDATWNADASEVWLQTGTTTRLVDGKTYKTDWQDGFHFYMEEDLTFDQMVRASIGMLRTNSVATGDWMLSKGGVLRAAVMERALHETVARRIAVSPTGKIGFHSAEDMKAVAGLYWNDLVVQNKVPPGAVNFNPALREFVLDDTVGKILGKETASLAELRGIKQQLAEAGYTYKGGESLSFDDWMGSLLKHKGAHDGVGSYHRSIGGKKHNPFGVSRLKTRRTYSNATGSNGNAQSLREAYERGVNGVTGYQHVPAATPMDSVMQFMANRAYWTDATHLSQGTKRAGHFMDEMDDFLAKKLITADDHEMAMSLVRDLLEPQFGMTLRQIDGPAAAGSSVGWIMRNVVKGDETMALYARVGGQDLQTVVEKRVASAKARNLETPEARRTSLFADEFTDADRTVQEMADRKAKMNELEAQRIRAGGEVDESLLGADSGYLDAGEVGGLPGRVDELEQRWERLFETEGGRVGLTREQRVDRAMNDWVATHAEPKVPVEPKPRRVESFEAGKEGPLSKNAKPGDTVTHKKHGEVTVKSVDGDMVTVTLKNGREAQFLRKHPVWQATTKKVKFIDEELPALKERRLKARATHDAWAEKRLAEEKRVAQVARKYRSGRPSEEAEKLVREVLEMMVTPGHAGDAQLRLALIAKEMLRTSPMAEGLKDEIIEVFRTIPPIYDNGRAVSLDALVGKPVAAGSEDVFPPAISRPTSAVERYQDRLPDVEGKMPSLDELKAREVEELKKYDEDVAAREQAISDILEERLAANPVRRGPVDTRSEEMALLTTGATKRHRVAKAIFDATEGVGPSLRIGTGTAESLVDDIVAVVPERPRSGHITDEFVDAEALKRHGEDFTDEQWHSVRDDLVKTSRAELDAWDDEVNAQLMARQTPEDVLRDGAKLVREKGSDERQTRIWDRAEEIQKAGPSAYTAESLDEVFAKVPPQKDRYGNSFPNPVTDEIRKVGTGLSAQMGLSTPTPRDLSGLASDLSGLGVRDLKYLARGKDTAVFEAMMDGRVVAVRLSIRSSHNFRPGPGIIQPLSRGKGGDVYWAVMPYAEVDDVTQEMVDTLKARLLENGWDWHDSAVDNAGIVDGQVVALDPEGFAWKGEGDPPTSMDDLRMDPPLPEEPDARQWAGAGDEGVHVEIDPRDGAEDVQQNAKMVWEALGLSEERYYQRLIVRNKHEMDDLPMASPRWLDLRGHNDSLLLALRSVRRQKRKNTYVKPIKKMQDAYDGALKVEAEVSGVIPDGKMAYYGRTEEAIELEHARSIRVRRERAVRAGKVDGLGLPASVMEDFKPEHWRGLTKAVADEVNAVQPPRTSALGLGGRRNPTDAADDLLRTHRDKKRNVREAVQRGLDKYAAENGVPAWDIELYWRVRTLMSGSEGKMRRGIAMLETAGSDPTDFLNLRRAATDREAFEQVKWWLHEHPHATPEEAAEYFKLVNQTSGKIEEVSETLTHADIAILDGMFWHFTGVTDMSDKRAVREALGKYETKPPMDDRNAMRVHQEETGRWSPRTIDDVITKGAWSMDEEIEYWSLNYEDIPAWLSDPRVQSGKIFKDLDTHTQVMRELGGFDDAARLERELRGETRINIEDYAHGKKKPDGSWEIKPQKDAVTERQFAIERYGARVHTDGRLHAMPWLMTPDELIEFVSKHGEIDGIISSKAEILAVETAIQEVAAKYVDMFMDIVDPKAQTVALSSADIHMIAFEMVQQLVATTPWKTVMQRAKGSGRGFLDTWGGLWTGLVLINPAFVISNAIDTPTKTLLFAMSEKHAKKIYSQRARQAISGPEALGLAPNSQFLYGRSARGARERAFAPIGYGWGVGDRVGGLWDGITGGVAERVLRPIEDKSKTELGRMLYDGYWDEFADDFLKGRKSMANPKAQTLTEEQVGLLIKLRVKDKLQKLYPSLADAGLGERMLNRLFPFISYNFKNKLLWTSWVLDHPWSIKLLQEAQAQVSQYNEEWWNEKFPGLNLPEHLAHQIPLWTSGFFLDFGMFTDAARGASWITSRDKSILIEDFIRYWIRPLPQQESFIMNALYDVTDKLTGHGFGGRYVWRRVYDEHGEWQRTGGFEGSGYEQDYVGPGTAWGDRRFDYWNNMFPLEGLRDTLGKALHEQKMPEDAVVRIIGNIMDFSEFGHVSETALLWWQYYQLVDESYDVAKDWLQNTAEGQRLSELAEQQFWDPDAPEKPYGTELRMNNYQSLFYNDKGEFEPPDAAEMRRRHLSQQAPQLAGLIRDANSELYALRDAFDQRLDALDPYDDEARAHLWKLRRASEGAHYQLYPELYGYYAFGKTTEEWYAHRAQSALDTQRSQYYALYDWDNAPPEGPKREKWLKEREAYIRANPEFAKSLADEYSQWQASLNRVDRARDLAIQNNESAEHVRTWAQARDFEGLAKAASTLIDYNARAFSMEAAGYNDKGEFKFKPDTGWRKYLKGDDPAKAFYADAMRSVGQRSVDEKGEFDVNKWWRSINRSPELRAEYLEREGLSRVEWATKGSLYAFHAQWAKAAEKGQWDKAWRLYEDMDQRTKEYWKEQNPKGFTERLRSYEYSNAMGRWVAYFERGDSRGAMNYFYSLPKWMQDRYYANNPGKRYSKGQSSAYVQALNGVFDAIDAGDWDKAERLWFAMPSHMRSQYYASNPDSTMFRGGKGGSGTYSGGTGGGIPDAKFKQYTRAMGQWVELLRDGEDAKADEYFEGLPQWMKDFYYQNNPDKKFQKDNDRMLGLASEYFVADAEERAAMLRRNPGLARWLNENDTVAARANAIRYAYQKLPDDPWLKRVYREKYPEVFSDEAKGQAKIDSVMETLNEFPQFQEAWLEQYEGIVDSMAEALKYMKPRPREVQVDHSRERRPNRGMSAEDVRKHVEKLEARTPVYPKRLPRIR